MSSRAPHQSEVPWKFLPPASQTLEAYLCFLMDVQDVRVATDILHKIPRVFFTDCVVLKAPALTRGAANGLFERNVAPPKSENWLNYLKAIQGSLREAHALGHPEVFMFMQYQRDWAVLKDAVGSIILRHLLVDCVIIQRLSSGDSRFLQIAGSVLTKNCFQAVGIPQNNFSKDEVLTWKSSLHVKDFCSKYPLGKKNPLNSGNGKEIVFRNEKLADLILESASHGFSWFLDAIETFSRNLKSYKFSGKLEKMAPTSNGLAIIKSATPMQCFREIMTIDKLAVRPVRARRIVREILSDIIPTELLGSKSNKYAFLKNVEIFMRMGLYDTAPASRLILGLKSKPFESLSSSASEQAKSILAELAQILFTRTVIPLIKYCFYVTDADPSIAGCQVQYFRKNVWCALTTKAVEGFINFQGLKTAIRPTIPDCDVRWIPKAKGLRPIVRQTQILKKRSRTLLSVLNAVRSAHPGITGHSVMTRDHAYSALRRNLGTVGMGPYSVMTADIRNCYESVDHSTLFQALSSIRQTTPQFSFTNFTIYTFSPNNSIPVRFKQIAYPEGDIKACFNQIKLGSVQAVITPPDWKNRQSTVLSWEEATARIRDIISGWTFGFGKQILKIGTKGLVQGSSLAGALVAIYYGTLDKQLDGRAPTKSIILRLVDDFLCITNEPHIASSVAHTIEDGRIFGDINKDKSTGNFGRYDRRISWIGFNIDPSDTRLNFTIHDTDVKVDESVVLRTGGFLKNSQALAESLARSQRQRLLPILFDPAINSEPTITRNAIFAGVAMGSRLCALARLHQRTTGRQLDVQQIVQALVHYRHFQRHDSKVRSLFVTHFLARLRREGLI